MRLAPSTLFLLLAFSTAAAAQSPGSGCDSARTPREHMVCADPKLAELDARVSMAYKNLESFLSQPAADAVKADRQEWLQWLDKVCPPAGDKIHDAAGCLEQRYDEEANELANEPLHADGLVIYPRTHFVFVAGQPTPKEQPAGNDPGYGDGAFEWPQIDNPTPAQQAWNAAILEATISGSGFGQKRPKTLGDTVDSGGYVDESYTISAANKSFIDVQLESSSYGWGAAHPLTGNVSFSWWLSKGRALVADDVFATNSGWHETLVPLTLAKLQQDPGPEALWQPGPYIGKNQLHDAIADGVAHPESWTVSSEGITITFGQYAVGPYSSGMPSAHFSWPELQPMLASGFDPAALPRSLEEAQ